ncbi:MAG: Rieske 2Fe-2S domain-containing protein [Polyangiaceae bacterium]|nr:Rieske 2Fe-2S domain-containing protein [Polyangiaceae bacterium]
MKTKNFTPADPERLRGTFEPSFRPEPAWYPLLAARVLQPNIWQRLLRKVLHRQVDSKLVSIVFYDRPIVVWRDQNGAVRAAFDRCPHRSMPVSLGERTPEGGLRCPYHGWEFTAAGDVARIPCLVGESSANISLTMIPAIEQSDMIWLNFGSTLSRPPAYSGAHPESQRIIRQVVAQGDLLSTAENALDIPHTAVVHRGLFRSGKKHPIEAISRRTQRAIEIEYVGEPAPRGILALLLGARRSPLRVEHWDRFLLPTTIEVEYRLGPRLQILVRAFALPIDPRKTRLLTEISIHSPFPFALLRLVLEPIARLIFAQDNRILSRQAQNRSSFGPQPEYSTKIDLMGSELRRLLKRGLRADQDSALNKTEEAQEQRTKMEI